MPHVELRGVVGDDLRLELLEGRRHVRRLADVPREQRRGGGQVALGTRAEIIQHGHLVPVAHVSGGDVRADETGSARDQDSHGATARAPDAKDGMSGIRRLPPVGCTRRDAVLHEAGRRRSTSASFTRLAAYRSRFQSPCKRSPATFTLLSITTFISRPTFSPRRTPLFREVVLAGSREARRPVRVLFVVDQDVENSRPVCP